MSLIEKINTFDNFELLKNESIKLVNTLDLTQISLQVAKDNISWTQSGGWLSSKTKEFNFNEIHPKLKNTVFEEYITTSPIKLYRTRIMVLKSNTSYSTHRDPFCRIHIPIVTNKQTAFLFPEDNFMFQMEADGSVYYSNTKRMHTYINWSKEDRIHIVSTIMK
jgi:hypothetical protein